MNALSCWLGFRKMLLLSVYKETSKKHCIGGIFYKNTLFYFLPGIKEISFDVVERGNV